MKNEVINVMLADDHELIRHGLSRIISFEKNLSIVGQAENGKKILEMIKTSVPDVVLLDLNMPIVNGIDALKEIKKQWDNIKVIMLTVENDVETIFRAIDIGADGYVLKDSAGEEIVDAIKTVHNGDKYIDKSLVSILFFDRRGKNKKAKNVLECLSKREIEVLYYISKGFSNKEVGEELFLSEKTIKNYASNIFRKIDVSDRVQATIMAIENDIETLLNL